MIAHRVTRVAAGTVAGLALVAALAAPASARPEPESRWSPVAMNTVGSSATCALQRIGDQFVRCDNLTGMGVKAPAWITEQLP